ncbi:MAG: hypothetical protein Q8P05_06040 [Candidatus Diapherotrites archaeon]|nr:hypothetical protein [Candidatus Diapherotrites archaeon]
MNDADGKTTTRQWSRNPVFYFILGLFLLSAGSSVHAQLGDFPGEFAFLAEIQKTNFLPSTIHAGDTVSLAVDIHNKGSSITIQDLNAFLDVGDQFEPVSLTDVESAIAPGATKTLIFSFRVKEDTIPGHYPVILSLSYLRNGLPVTELHEIIVPVTGVQKNIDVVLEPRVVNPGNQTNVIFTLTNVSGSPISNISFSWAEESSLILPVGSDNKRYISIIQPGEKVNIQYTVAADPNIATGIYPLTIDLSFIDSNGTQEQSSEIGVIVGGTTDFEVSAEMTATQLSVSIANIGSNNAGAVVAKLLTPLGSSSGGSNVSILGNLNKGDFTIATFPLASKSTPSSSPNSVTSSGSVSRSPTPTSELIPRTLEMEISYTDTTGERQSVQKTISLPATSVGNGSNTTPVPTGASPLIAWGLLILLVGGGIGYNQWRAKKDWKALAVRIIGVIILFLVAIFLLGRNELAVLGAAVVSAGLFIHFFQSGELEKGRTSSDSRKPERR